MLCQLGIPRFWPRLSCDRLSPGTQVGECPDYRQIFLGPQAGSEYRRFLVYWGTHQGAGDHSQVRKWVAMYLDHMRRICDLLNNNPCQTCLMLDTNATFSPTCASQIRNGSFCKIRRILALHVLTPLNCRNVVSKGGRYVVGKAIRRVVGMSWYLIGMWSVTTWKWSVKAPAWSVSDGWSVCGRCAVDKPVQLVHYYRLSVYLFCPPATAATCFSTLDRQQTAPSRQYSKNVFCR